MYKVLFIDDEPIIREGMRHVIDWEALGFVIEGDYGHAKEGLKAIIKQQPDLVFVDIKMPGMTGLELVTEAKKEGYQGRFIVLSGYSNFDYAKASIKLGVDAYLLKPIDEDELVDCLLEIKESIQQEEHIHSQISQFKDQSIHEAWRAVIDGRTNDWLGHSELKRLSGPFLVGAIFFHKALSRRRLKALFEEHKITKAFVIFKDDLSYLIFPGATDATKDDFKQAVVLIKKLIDEQAYAILAEPVDDIHKIFAEVKTIQDAEQVIYVLPSQVVYMTHHVLKSNDEQDQPLNIQANIQRVIHALEFKDKAILSSVKEDFIQYFQTNSVMKDRVEQLMFEFVLHLTDQVKAQYPEVTMTAKNEWYEIIIDADHLFDLLDELMEEIWAMSNQMKGFQFNADDDMEKVVAYVHHYFMKDLSLKVLAEIFSYNSSYLGKKFKKYTGDYFHVYLERFRIDKAKQLLTDRTIKIYEVSEAVGFNNMDYFYKKFKKHVGKSPKEYQLSLERD
jgi:two-component system response regulator YesN